jgi:hypothetical protein
MSFERDGDNAAHRGGLVLPYTVLLSWMAAAGMTGTGGGLGGVGQLAPSFVFNNRTELEVSSETAGCFREGFRRVGLGGLPPTLQIDKNNFQTKQI